MALKRDFGEYDSKIKLEAAIVFRGFIFRGFGYLQTLNYVQKFYPRIFPWLFADWVLLKAKKTIKGQNSGSLLSALLVLAGYSGDVTLVNKEGNLLCYKGIYS